MRNFFIALAAIGLIGGLYLWQPQDAAVVCQGEDKIAKDHLATFLDVKQRVEKSGFFALLQSLAIKPLTCEVDWQAEEGTLTYKAAGEGMLWNFNLHGDVPTNNLKLTLFVNIDEARAMAAIQSEMALDGKDVDWGEPEVSVNNETGQTTRMFFHPEINHGLGIRFNQAGAIVELYSSYAH